MMKRTMKTMPAFILLAGLLLTSCGTAGGGVVRVATDATWPPFEYLDDESKELVGLDIELMKAIADRAGFQVEFINVSFDTLLAGMVQCQYDAAISAITITPDRAVDFAFSAPYFEAGQIVVIRSDNTDITGPDDLGGKVVGVQRDTTGDVEAQKIEGAIIQRYDDIELAFQDLMNAQIDAVVADNPLALGIVGSHPDLLTTVGETFTDENYGIAVCKTNTDLVEKINAALAELKGEGVIDELTQTWIVGSNQ
jgi:polar amino acid transport system substrate-binding protein